MSTIGWIILCIFVLGPLAGAAILSASSRTRRWLVAPAWLAAFVAALQMTAALAVPVNLPKSEQQVFIVMGAGVTAWVALAVALLFPRRRPAREPLAHMNDDNTAGRVSSDDDAS